MTTRSSVARPASLVAALPPSPAVTGGRATDAHQPRERAVLCSKCLRRTTFEFHAVCEFCGPITCERCS